MQASAGAPGIARQMPDLALREVRVNIVIVTMLVNVELPPDSFNQRDRMPFSYMQHFDVGIAQGYMVFVSADLQLHRRARIGVVTIADRNGRKNSSLSVLAILDIGAHHGCQKHILMLMALRR